LLSESAAALPEGARNACAAEGLAALAHRASLRVLSCRALEQCVKHSHTKYRITMYPYVAEVTVKPGAKPLPTNMAWHTLGAAGERTFPSAFLKVMALLSDLPKNE
jgi:hypothetical protein